MSNDHMKSDKHPKSDTSPNAEPTNMPRKSKGLKRSRCRKQPSPR